MVKDSKQKLTREKCVESIVRGIDDPEKLKMSGYKNEEELRFAMANPLLEIVDPKSP